MTNEKQLTHEDAMQELAVAIRTYGAASKQAIAAQQVVAVINQRDYANYFNPPEAPAEPTVTSEPKSETPPLSPQGLGKVEAAVDKLNADNARLVAENKELKQKNETQRQSILKGLSDVKDDGDDEPIAPEEPTVDVDAIEFEMDEFGRPRLPKNLITDVMGR